MDDPPHYQKGTGVVDDLRRAMRGLRENIDLHGRNGYSDADLHPGAVLVTFDGLTRSTLVLDGSGDGRQIDKDEAISAAGSYMEHRSLLSPGQRHSHVFTLGLEDTPAFVTPQERNAIVDAIAAGAVEQASRHVAEEWSDVEPSELNLAVEQGREPPVKVCSTESAYAVNGEATLSWEWERRLGMSDRHPDFWDHDSIARLEEWLRSNGYRKVELKEKPATVEYGVVDVDRLVSDVAEELDLRRIQVESVCEFDCAVGEEEAVYDVAVSMYVKSAALAYCLFTLERRGYGEEQRCVVSIADATLESARAVLDSLILEGNSKVWMGELSSEGPKPQRKSEDDFCAAFSTPNGSLHVYYLCVVSQEEYASADDVDFHAGSERAVVVMELLG